MHRQPCLETDIHLDRVIRVKESAMDPQGWEIITHLHSENATPEFGPSAGCPCPACALTRNLKVCSYSHKGGPAVALDSICLHAAKKSEHIGVHFTSLYKNSNFITWHIRWKIPKFFRAYRQFGNGKMAKWQKKKKIGGD